MTDRADTGSMPDRLEDVLQDVEPDEATALRALWTEIGSLPPEEPPAAWRMEAARRAVMTMVDRPGRSRVRPAGTADRPAAARDRRATEPPPARLPRVLTLAACILILTAVAIWWSMPVTIDSPIGQRRTLTLADGSVIELNSGASIRHRRFFGRLGRDRDVILEGEAFFDVASGAAPFRVETFNASVTVTGTRFNVRAWQDLEASTFVTVQEGRVVVQDGRRDARTGETELVPGRNGVTLSAGEAVRVTAGGYSDTSLVDVGEAIAWREGDLIYKNRMLGVVLDDVMRRYGTAVRLDPAISETTHINVALRNPAGAEAVLRDLAGALGLQYTRRADGFELHRP